ARLRHLQSSLLRSCPAWNVTPWRSQRLHPSPGFVAGPQRGGITGFLTTSAAVKQLPAELQVTEERHRQHQGEQEEEADEVHDGLRALVDAPPADQLDAQEHQPSA